MYLDSLPKQTILIGESQKVAKQSKSSQANVTRISAKDKSVKARKSAPTKIRKPKRQRSDSDGVERRGTPISYFKGAWYELQQVRWPTRRATWGMTGAVLAFSAFFVIFILLVDALFKYIFELILK